MISCIKAGVTFSTPRCIPFGQIVYFLRLTNRCVPTGMHSMEPRVSMWSLPRQLLVFRALPSRYAHQQTTQYWKECRIGNVASCTGGLLFSSCVQNVPNDYRHILCLLILCKIAINWALPESHKRPGTALCTSSENA